MVAFDSSNRYSYGTPTDSLIYGRKQQYFPKFSQVRLGGQCCGGDCDSKTISFKYDDPWAGVAKTAIKAGFLGNVINSVLNFGACLLGRKSSYSSNTSIATSPYAQLNTRTQIATPTSINPLKNLQSMYSKYSVLPNQDGTYTLTTGNGDNVKTGTYEELMKGMNPSSTPSTDTSTTVSSPQGNNSSQRTSQEKPTGTVDDGENPDSKTQKRSTSGKTPSAADFSKFSGNMTVHDDGLGDKGDINGEFKVKEQGTEATKNYPKSVQIGSNTYTFQKVDSDGTVWYQSASGEQQSYRLENSNGQYTLVQHEGDDGVGAADQHKTRNTSGRGVGTADQHKTRNASGGSVSAAKTKTTSTQEGQAKTAQVTINSNDIVDNGVSYSYTYIKPPKKAVTVTLNKTLENSGWNKTQIQNALQQKLNEELSKQK